MQQRKKIVEGEESIVTYEKKVVYSVINLACREIGGVASLSTTLADINKLSQKRYSQGIKLIFDENRVLIEVYINVYFGYSVNDVAYKVQENVKRSVESMTDFKVETVNVNITGVVFDPSEEAAVL